MYMDTRMYMALISQENRAKISHFGVSIHPIYNEAFIVLGNENQIEKLVASGLVENLTPHPFPLGPFKRSYEYLGDFRVNEALSIDLSLIQSSSGDRYWIEGDLPLGLVFSDGQLRGTPREPTPILRFTVHAQSVSNAFSKTYMLRCFEGQNKARTFTANDYIRVGFGESLVDYDPYQTYYRLVPAALPQVTGTPFEHAKLAAKKIYAQAASKPVTLMVSGGIDSQCMMQAFAAAKVPFRAIFMRDKNNVNSLDADSVIRFSQKMNIPLHIFDEDFIGYIKSYSYLPMAFKYRFNNPEYGLLLSLMDRFPEAYPVYAGRPISISSGLKGERVLGLCGDETWSKARYLERNHREGAVEFLIHTPELMASFLQMKTALGFPSGGQWSYHNKLALLKEGGFDISLAPPVKATGFEDLFDRFPQTPFGNEIWTMHRAPLKSLFPHPPERNGILLKEGALADDGMSVRRDFQDGFSFAYLMKNHCGQFH